MEDPSVQLPRDTSGSYLHLKLKRFASIKDLKMAFAKKTWTQYPHDVEVDMAPSNRSSCRQCHSVIGKGDLRVRLWLQCHKGCKNSAFFHGKTCIWEYPETKKIDSVEEFVGLRDLPKDDQLYIETEFANVNNGKVATTPETKRTSKDLTTTKDSTAKRRRKL